MPNLSTDDLVTVRRAIDLCLANYADHMLEEMEEARLALDRIQAEGERQKERADHWQHRVRVMGATASKGEAEVERLRAALEMKTHEYESTASFWRDAQARIAELEGGIERLADGDVPWADGMVRAGSKDAHDLQAFARSMLEP